MTERRTAYRYPVALPAQVVAAGEVHDTTVENVSRTGLFVRTTADHGAPLGITLRLSDATLNLSGEVVRHTGNGIGVRLDNLDRTAQQELANYVLARSYSAQAAQSRA